MTTGAHPGNIVVAGAVQGDDPVAQVRAELPTAVEFGEIARHWPRRRASRASR
ncbi:hypothetical protein [Plantactinospora mayteni]|uniref:hypothetical protein n=1 Tax=Plantactinospora mayteni TaxID=566021 RepID=UPI001940F932|nr:hypothetical protein [Plantactinospora mayteni]